MCARKGEEMMGVGLYVFSILAKFSGYGYSYKLVNPEGKSLEASASGQLHTNSSFPGKKLS